ncbi:cytochrome c-type biogenesis protein CcmF [Thiogranum longum]|uniref:Cytochrome c-type biogenesis protein CcmF n=1 Tax=Thiogranum longum TaxID=1537524 RepID=A0A4R1HE67_9GAMM|nr:heme lyase CcmF/NrfE family subunit [Thiogranum longum]TCK18605.1 cytochrome c-type biogenesis protein CcmF [Thiogranum longum]
MIPELGHFALILALCLAVVQATVPLIGSLNRTPSWVAMARPLAYGQFVFLAFAFAALVYAFLSDDFSVLYVAQHGNTELPTIYKISAVWGAHEGSLLLWVLILSAWSVAVAGFTRNLPDVIVARVLSVMGMISIGFLSFLLFTSNPFARLFPVALQGGELNPLLQDFGLAIHPPMLYMGYVGMSVAFSFAIAALIGGKLDNAWARWSRPWTLVAWMFLTIGIVLGSWWAYYELGWGGWWFWDPVENASFMPWLAGTALIHSLAVTEKRGAFKRWTVLLALLAFSLSLLGTFLVRSGVLTSVHAFASDPARGLFILVFLMLVIGGSLLLYALRAPGISRGGGFDILSRETLLLGNNLLLILITALVLLGTLAPLLYDALQWGKISVGFPWFNSMFVTFAPLMILLMGAGPLTRWKHQDPAELLRQLRVSLAISIAAGVAVAMPFMSGSWSAGLAVGLSMWLLTTLLTSLHLRLRNRGGIRKLFADLAGRGSRSYYGMWVAHLGIAMFVVGVTFVTQFDVEKDVRMSPGQEIMLNDYLFRFDGVAVHEGPNYTAQRGTLHVSRDGEEIAVLHPEKRKYRVQTKPMTEAGIDAGLFRDIYVSLGESLGGGDWALRLYYKPMVRWIWLGGLLMALGGLLAASDPRYRLRVLAKFRGEAPGNALAAGGRA